MKNIKLLNFNLKLYEEFNNKPKRQLNTHEDVHKSIFENKFEKP